MNALAHAAIALSLTYEALAQEAPHDPLIRRDADGTWFCFEDQWYEVRCLPERIRRAYLQHEIQIERGRKYGRA